MTSKIAVIGTGYVGLTTGACFAKLGHEVVCADIDSDKIERLSRGEIPIHEAGLEEMVHEGIESGRLTFSLGSAGVVGEAEFVYLCVPTPQAADGSADLSYIEAAAAEISPRLRPGTIVVNLADCVQVWTNDRYRAAVHRVVPMTDRDRYSIPYFFIR